MYKTLFNNLWKATTAYMVGSFALIQFASVSFTYFDLELSIGLTNTELMKILYIVLGIGFPSTVDRNHRSVEPSRRQRHAAANPKAVG